ncbi:uncharacterized protein LOC112048481 [Bicyclus anynana]|uniref:Uncharacterized protein LOC112048481 n=1 Tax=Bicyclus anynana TaxID=110368 RepID=A0A6J1N9V6_BICAN|nr:uncharacterized protein LOC112048481 [Bicyclus anynana]
MSFLTEYFDEFRQHPIRKTKMCRPENRWAKLEGKWLDPKVGSEDKEWTDEEVAHFIKETMRSLRGQSTYYNDFCSHLPTIYKTRRFEPRPKRRRPCKPDGAAPEEAPPPPAAKLAIKDTELMRTARDLYERDMDKPTLEPLATHARILGYVRPYLYKTGISEYQHNVARLAYELVRDDRIPRYYAHNGCRPRYPAGGPRQPQLDGAPYDGERLY